MIARLPRINGTRRAQHGFNLLEALVAMAIAALAFTALYRTVGQSSRVVGDVEARVEAAMVARSVLASATFAEDLAPLQAGQQGPWQWRMQIAQQAVALTNTTGEPLEDPTVPAARVAIQVAREGLGTEFEMTAWKPYRKAP